MICAVLTEPTLEAALESAKACAAHCDTFELRVDRLVVDERSRAGRFPGMLAAASVPSRVVLTIRREVDGGSFYVDETVRRELFSRSLLQASESGHPFFALDLEEDFASPEIIEQSALSATRIIRSINDKDGMPAELSRRVIRLANSTSGIVRVAVTPRNTRELLQLCLLSRQLTGVEYALQGLGDWGHPSRILAGRLGSVLVFGSPAEVKQLDQLYRFGSIDGSTAIYGVIGNPIGHSRSPEYHNRRFAEDGLNAVYLPFRVDDIDPFFELARLLDIRGVSVTIPHKESVMRYLETADAAVRATGACNTVIRSSGDGESPRYDGTNTDVAGFLQPLLRKLNRDTLEGLHATVVGAGGAARGIVFALLSAGASVLVVNRTPARAEALISTLRGTARGGAALIAAPLDASGAQQAAKFCDIVVQTTSVGMHPNEGVDPFPEYQFAGREVVCDIIYTPERTAFLDRATASGCMTLTGRAMFDGQAAEQYSRFSALVRR